MPYISRKKYKSRREKQAQTSRNFRIIFSAALIIGIVILIMKWVSIKDYIITSFY